MKEKKQGYAVLEDVDAPTFDRFLEWACKGFYTPPGPSNDVVIENGDHGQISKEADQGIVSPTPRDLSYKSTTYLFTDSFGEYQGCILKRGNSFFLRHSSGRIEGEDRLEGAVSRLRQNLRDSFYSRQPYVGRNTNTAPPRKNREASEDYTNILLCHAQLYVFADAQDIQALKLLALDELHAVLAVFELHPERTGDIVELLRYVYAHTTTPSEGEEPLRKVVSDYMAFEMDVLMKDEYFAKSMFQDGGDMLCDFMSSVTKRIKA